MSKFVVIAEFAVVPEHKQEFLDVCVYDHERSTADEPGCRQFDVIVSDEAPDAVILYEVYDDKAAFDAHLKTPHFEVFMEAVKKFGVTTTVVRTLARHHP
ncbi:Quinol monooxygenase YgiN [Granulicella pectinivorans]|jgi:quinol monooxygenase YgiN|uniref:Quinol monooxygenase YgiN n=1 Tax=Granulicella pectinivorans TaxID=474950 RepID=A0A1I6MSD9_9BACT|nr:putative quinol monooxygenase [Granulicella pectinivorans]SFS18622.1 Quinol monooxygenase YgiN [Granulicella pectinivorans]